MEQQQQPNPKSTDILDTFKSYIAQAISSVSNGLVTFNDVYISLENCKVKGFDFSFPMLRMRKFQPTMQLDLVSIANQWASQLHPDEFIGQVQVYTHPGKTPMHYLNVALNYQSFVSQTLKAVLELGKDFGKSTKYAGKTICVEFSSPNIAKPFHAGHLRSTIIGNFLTKLYKHMGATVHSINYLGDWGTQYGLLALGFEKYGNNDDLASHPMKHLYEVYVKINDDAEKDPSIQEQARAYFKKMEDSDPEALALWQKFRTLSIEEYKKVYKRLNVEFDVYSGESMMSSGMAEALQTLQNLNLLVPDEHGGLVVDLSSDKLGYALIQKSDGATLYLTRDIAAAKARYDEFKFDKSIYVVAAQQNHHFQQLFKVLEKMGYDWVSKCVHVNYGLVLGMKTRKGQAVFLEEILDEAQQIMLEKMEENTKGKLAEIDDVKETSDNVGISAVIFQDLSAKRIRDYEFSWGRMFSLDETESEPEPESSSSSSQSSVGSKAAEEKKKIEGPKQGYTGPYVQYTHVRLCSLLDVIAATPLEACDNLGALLPEQQAIALVLEISKFPSVLEQAEKFMEPSVLVNYLFDLCGAISSVWMNVYAKHSAQPDLQKARKLLYWSAKQVLEVGLTILGLNPLQRM